MRIYQGSDLLQMILKAFLYFQNLTQQVALLRGIHLKEGTKQKNIKTGIKAKQ